ncbi:hypothetical protein HN51_035017 [Arachis hypogaea]|nr:Transmembrane protein, putative [Arachis hypogaea]
MNVIMDHHHQHEFQHLKNNEKEAAQSPFDGDGYSMITLKRAYAFFAEWILLILTCSIALFFFPLTPSFTLHSITSSSSINNHPHFITTNLTLGIQIDDSNPVGSAIYYDSLTLSLFHHRQELSTFMLQQQGSSIEANFHNVSLKIDEWENSNGESPPSSSSSSTNCGFVYLDMWFNARVRYFQPLLPSIGDKLEGNCGELKLQICSSSDGVRVQPILASCDVKSDLVYKIRVLLSVLLILLLLTAVAVPFLVEQFFCPNSDS